MTCLLASFPSPPPIATTTWPVVAVPAASPLRPRGVESVAARRPWIFSATLAQTFLAMGSLLVTHLRTTPTVMATTNMLVQLSIASEGARGVRARVCWLKIRGSGGERARCDAVMP